MVKLFVEAVPAIFACCDALVTASDVASAARFQNERRRAEHLAWRRVVRRELGRGVAIDYNEVGAPVVDTPNIYISVSHGGGVVAVAVASCRVGVDVECTDRDFSRAMSRYLSATEAALSDDAHWPAKVWCSKEAMYKLYGERGMELLDLRIDSYDAEHDRLEGGLVNGARVIVEISRPSGNLVVATAVFK